MKTRCIDPRLLAAASALALAAASGTAPAQAPAAQPSAKAAAGSSTPAGQEGAAVRHVTDSAAVLQRMAAEPRMKALLQQAKGIFVVPHYGRAAIGVGAAGGAGVLMVKRTDGTWSEPVFYNIGGISAGAQIGAEAGPIALVLNNDKAVNKFMQKNQFSLNAAAGLTLINWSKVAQGTVGEGDVVLWAGTKGLYGNLVAVGVNDIRLSQRLTDAYYHQGSTTVTDVFAGKYSNPHSDVLKQAVSNAPSAAATPPARY